MNVRKIEVDAALPIPLASVKKALRVDGAFEDDTITRKFLAAVELVEEKTGRILRPSTLEVSFDAWPCDLASELVLPVWPVRDVLSVSYLPAAGGAVAVDGSLYDWRRMQSSVELYFFSTFTYPTVSAERRSPVVVTVEAGYDTPAEAGDDPELKLPARVEELVLLLTAHWYKNREAATAGEMADVPFSAKLLFEELRIFR